MISFSGYPVQQIEARSKQLCHYILKRAPPLTDKEVNAKSFEIEQKIIQKSKA